jgi:hypothetical protein
MSVTVVIHIANEDPIICELEDMPSPEHNFIIAKNPRKRDGKDVHYLQEGVTTVIWPLARINFIEMMPTEEEERLIGFVRE